jgi:glutamate/tyrosine decarboxylase-like PLP-dependent enzyme
VVARAEARKEQGNPERWVIACSEEAHSSIVSAANVMDVDVLKVAVDQNGRLQGSAVAEAIDHLHATTKARVFAVVATSGTTNLGIIDDLKGVGKAAHDRGIWFHVDGAYGLAALCAPSVREMFDGVEAADSFIVDPHKWLFAPYDACALVYRNPELAKQAHSQHASYLDTLKDENWSPSDYAIHLTRRTRGLPFWFSLAAHGTDAYAEAMEQTLRVAQQAADLVRKHPNLELLCEPELSIVAFTRKGWVAADYQKWSDQLLEDQVGFIPPSSHRGQPILRFAIVNPWTKISDISIILERL